MKILLTGANGYIGRRLLPVLVEEGHEVYCLVRDRRRLVLEHDLAERISIYEADFLNNDIPDNLPKTIDVAYYLIHSMGRSYRHFDELEAQTAENFSAYIQKTDVQQLVFLSGIANADNLSKHLSSRLNVENILANSGKPLTVLRAAIIIGSGSASFEIIRDIVEKLPFMVAPVWLKTRCQPIAVSNVLQYLQGVALKPQTYNKTFDIGGPDILTYKEMILAFADIRKLKRYILTVPVLSPKLSSLWLYFVTSVSFTLARSLVDSMLNETVCKNNEIQEILPIQLISYRKALESALSTIQDDRVTSSWKDALSSSKMDYNFLDNIKVPEFGVVKDVRKVPINAQPEKVLDNIWQIGGERGWYYMNFLWRLRGLVDKMIGGVGLRRGRRSPSLLTQGDALDFWRVLKADYENQHLLLYAEMKLPGEAWLEFRISRENGHKYLIQTATFRPRGLLGRFYWYAILPFHKWIFKGMACNIVKFNPEKAVGNV